MPVTKSVEKQMRVAARREQRNKPVRSAAKTTIVKAEKLIQAGDVEGAKSATVTAVSTLDKAAQKGVLHANNAARRKSRLVKKLNKAAAALKPTA